VRREVGALARAPSYYADVLARNILKARSLAGFANAHGLHDAIFYDYWFENTTLALALVRRTGAIRTALCRAHGFDVYDERWSAGAVPFRAAKAAGLDAVFAVSGDGRRYLEQRSAGLRGKVRVAHLGVTDPERSLPGESGAAPLILTCGRLIPSKQTHLVPEVLARLGRPVRWVHLGDGPERERVAAAAARWGGQVASDLRGQVENRAIADFYGSHHVDLLLSLSTSEGLPVTMMEAQSFGIPIVARAVNGVPEIVTPATGILVRPDASVPEVAAAVSAALRPERFRPSEIRAFFRANFDAQVNYSAFADAIIALHDSTSPAA
jgi:glycosyltransferase involved in cell wall biosynthesis